jgi:hypothetical protein
MLAFVKFASVTAVGLSVLISSSLGVAGACKAKGNDAPAAAKDTPASEVPAPEVPAPETPASEAPAPAPTANNASVAPTAPSLPSSATEEERELAKAFTERFLAAIEKGDASGWPALHTKARRDALEANDAVDKSYEAWRKGTLTAIPFIRAADIALLRRGERYTLRFVGVKVPTDPDVEYSMTLAIEDGEMRISEK